MLRNTSRSFSLFRIYLATPMRPSGWNGISRGWRLLRRRITRTPCWPSSTLDSNGRRSIWWLFLSVGSRRLLFGCNKFTTTYSWTSPTTKTNSYSGSGSTKISSNAPTNQSTSDNPMKSPTIFKLTNRWNTWKPKTSGPICWAKNMLLPSSSISPGDSIIKCNCCNPTSSTSGKNKIRRGFRPWVVYPYSCISFTAWISPFGRG